jgi:hypothetical protein
MPNIKDIKELEFYNLLLRYGEGKVTKSELWSWIETALTTQQKEWEKWAITEKMLDKLARMNYNAALDDILSLLRLLRKEK